MSSNAQLMATAGRLVLRRPGLMFELIRMAAATAPRGWYRRPPFLPLPEPTYRDWRMTTAYGSPDGAPSVQELEEFLDWRRAMRSGGVR